MVAPSSQFTEGSFFSPTDSRHGREWSPSYRQNMFVLKYLTLRSGDRPGEAEHVHKLLPLRKRCPGTQEHHGTAGCKATRYHKILYPKLVSEPINFLCFTMVLPWFYHGFTQCWHFLKALAWTPFHAIFQGNFWRSRSWPFPQISLGLWGVMIVMEWALHL